MAVSQRRRLARAFNPAQRRKPAMPVDSASSGPIHAAPWSARTSASISCRKKSGMPLPHPPLRFIAAAVPGIGGAWQATLLRTVATTQDDLSRLAC